MNQEPRHATLRDYAALLRRRWFVVVGAIVIAAALAAGYSLTQPKSYTADATLRGLNPTQNNGTVGALPAQTDGPQQIAAQAADSVTSSAVLEELKQRLGVNESHATLASHISASADPSSDLVTLEGTASSAAGAARLANTAAEAVADVANSRLRGQYTAAAKELRRRADALTKKFPGNATGLSPAEQQELQNLSTQQNQLTSKATGLDTLSLVARAIQITDHATPPASPSAPKPVRNGVIGGILGLILALIAVAVLESLDRRLRRPDEVAHLVGYPLVGALVKGGLGSVPGEGGNDLEQAAALDTFRMLRTNLRFAGDDDSPPRSVLVTSSLPREGKTTVAMGLALAAAASGMRTLLVEADVHRPVHAQRLGLRSGPGLADHLRDGLPPRDVLQVHRFADPTIARSANGNGNGNGNGHGPQEASLVCMTAGNVAGLPTEAIGSKVFADFLAEVQQAYDLVVVDSAPLLAVAETAQLVPLVEAVLFCVRLDQTTTEQAKAGREALERLPTRFLGLVTTDVKSGVGGGGYGYYSYAYSYRAQEKVG